MSQSGKSTLKAMLKTVLLTSLLFTVPIVTARYFGRLEQWELNSYDNFMNLRPAEKPDDRIVIVTVGDEDIEKLNQYPISDDNFAKLLEKLEQYQPIAIGLDIARDVPNGTGWERLEKVIKNSKTIVSGCMVSKKDYPGSSPAPGASDDRIGSPEFPPDSDEIIRRVIVSATPEKSEKPAQKQHLCNKVAQDNQIPSLSFLLAEFYLSAKNINPEGTTTGDVRFNKVVIKGLQHRFGSYNQDIVSQDQIMLNYRGNKKHFPEISISDVLYDKVNPQMIRDRIVLIGSTSKVSKDKHSTPYGNKITERKMDGVKIHAHATSQILSAVLDQRQQIQSWDEWGKILWIMGWAVGSGVIAFYNRRSIFFLIGMIAIGGTLWGVCYGLFLTQALWIPFIPALWAAVLTGLGVRMVELADRTGYSKALYAQLRDQIKRGGMESDRQGNYLESLVLRARSARQAEDAQALIAIDSTTQQNITPEMKALYEKVTEEVRQELEAQQLANQTTIGQSTTANRLKSLLKRAQGARP